MLERLIESLVLVSAAVVFGIPLLVGILYLVSGVWLPEKKE